MNMSRSKVAVFQAAGAFDVAERASCIQSPDQDLLGWTLKSDPSVQGALFKGSFGDAGCLALFKGHIWTRIP